MVKLRIHDRYGRGGSNQIFIENKLVTVVDEEIGGRLLDSHSNDVTPIFAKLGYQRREIAVSRNQNKRIDMVLLVRKIQRIHDHSNIRAVLPAVPCLWDIDQFNRRLMKSAFEI